MRNNNVIEQELLDAGYKKHVADFYRTLKSTDTLYQKCIKDGAGKRYYINIWVYDHTQYGFDSVGLQCEVQFTTEDDNVVDVTVCSNDIEYVENEFDNIWKRMGYDYKEKWDET